MPVPSPRLYTKAQALTDLEATFSRRPSTRFVDLPPALRRAIHRYWGDMAHARRAASGPALRPGRRSRSQLPPARPLRGPIWFYRQFLGQAPISLPQYRETAARFTDEMTKELEKAAMKSEVDLDGQG